MVKRFEKNIVNTAGLEIAPYFDAYEEATRAVLNCTWVLHSFTFNVIFVVFQTGCSLLQHQTGCSLFSKEILINNILTLNYFVSESDHYFCEFLIHSTSVLIYVNFDFKEVSF